MIIESLADQDMKQLRQDAIMAYKFLREKTCKCKACSERLKVNYLLWHPERYNNFNDAFKIVSLLENFGYPSYDYDSVLYTFYFHSPEPENINVQADGISLQQAICNTLVEYVKKWVSLKQSINNVNK